MKNRKTKIIVISSLITGVLFLLVVAGIFLFSPNGIISNMVLRGTYTHEANVETFDVSLFTIKSTANFENNTITMTVFDPVLNKVSLTRTGSYQLVGSDIIVTWEDTTNIGDLSFAFSWFIGDEWQVPFQRGKDKVIIDGDEYLKK